MRFVRPPAVALVTGASTGIGRATTFALAAAGFSTFGTIRTNNDADGLVSDATAEGLIVRPIIADVRDSESVRTAFANVVEAAGQVDVLVNNAGVGATGVVELTPPSQYAHTFDVNCIGAVRWIQAVLPGMRERRRGCIVNVTSASGRVASAWQSPYVASKWALEGLSECLALEAAPFDVRVVVIEPGVTLTAAFDKRASRILGTGGPYAPSLARLGRYVSAGLAQPTAPAVVGQVVCDAVTAQKFRFRHPCSWSGVELTRSRARTSDEAWIALAAIDDDDEYARAYEQLTGVDLSS